MSAAEAVAGWAEVNAVLALGILAALAAWFLYVSLAAHARSWWKRLAATPTRRQEFPGVDGGWLVMEAGTGVYAPTLAEAHARLDDMLAMIADDRMLRELEAEFNREQQA